MTDLYHHQSAELPPKPRTLGWILMGAGLVLLLAAVGVYFYHLFEQQERYAKPWEQPSVAKIPLGSPEDIEAKNAKVALLMQMTILLVGSLLALIVVATVAHRWRVRQWQNEEDRKRHQTREDQATRYQSLWEEAGRRVPLPATSEDLREMPNGVLTKNDTPTEGDSRNPFDVEEDLDDEDDDSEDGDRNDRR